MLLAAGSITGLLAAPQRPRGKEDAMQLPFADLLGMVAVTTQTQLVLEAR